MALHRTVGVSVAALLFLTTLAIAQDETPESDTAKPSLDAGVKTGLLNSGGRFEMRVLSGDSANELKVEPPDTPIPAFLTMDIKWHREDGWIGESFCTANVDAPPKPFSIGYTKRLDANMEPIIGVEIPAPPCWWPPLRKADLKIAGLADDQRETVIFNGVVHVSVLWFPLLLTFLAVGIVYPGCALVSWFVQLRRHKKDKGAAADRPTFWPSLDPVQLTANTYGRGSLSKLQIFGFTLVVFGILMFFQLRNRYLANLSTDIMLLLGISAFGAAGGKLTYTAKRRLGLDNWTWLKRMGWLPEKSDVVQRARWSDLFTDTDTKEFDIYSFQMAVFSVIVAFALVSTNANGLAAFDIPDQLLALLGLSQVIYVGGKAIEKTGYQELDSKITEVRQHEARFRDAKAASDKDAAEKERQAFKAGAMQVAEMFWATYEDQIKVRPKALDNLAKLEPEAA